MRLPDLLRAAPFPQAAAIVRALVLPLIAVAVPAAAQPSMPKPPAGLTETHRGDLRCAAAFAIVALEQAGGDALPGWPALASRGRTFFADTGERVMREAGVTRDGVRALIGAEVQALQSAADPDAALAGLAQPCLARLDATVAPLRTPTLTECAAIMELAYGEVYGREGLSPAAKDLKILASVLKARAHEAVVAQGRSGDQADAQFAAATDAMGAIAQDKAGGVDRYDIAHCYDLAKPDEKSHY